MSDTVQDFGFRAMTRFWAQAQLAALQAQEDAAKTIAEAFNAARETASAAHSTRDRPAPTEAVARATPFPDMSRLTEASETATDLWTAANDLSETLFAAAVATAGTGMAIAAGSLRGFTDPNGASRDAGTGGTLSGLVGQLVEGPQFADMLNGERQQARVFKAWLDLCQHRFAQNALVLNVWLRAGHSFAKELARRNRAGGIPLDGKAMLALWVETANRDLIEMQRSEPFLDVQGTVIRSSMELKVAQQDMAEGWANRLDLPTRTELDDVHRTVTQLKREMRSLKRQPPARAVIVTDEAKTPAASAAVPKPLPVVQPSVPADAHADAHAERPRSPPHVPQEIAPKSEIVTLPKKRVASHPAPVSARQRRLSS